MNTIEQGLDIDSLEAGPQLDALVAERVMGWVPDKIEIDGRLIWEGWRRPDGVKACPPDEFSSRLKYAWRVIYALGDRGWEPAIMGLDLGKPAERWHVTFCTTMQVHTAFGKTAPEAICRAALKATL